MSDVRMPRIPSAQKTELLSPGSRSNSGFASRVQSGKHELPGKSGELDEDSLWIMGLTFFSVCFIEIKDMQTTGALPSLSVLNIELRYAR